MSKKSQRCTIRSKNRTRRVTTFYSMRTLDARVEVRKGVAIGGCSGMVCLIAIIAFNPTGSDFCNRGARGNVWCVATLLETPRISVGRNGNKRCAHTSAPRSLYSGGRVSVPDPPSVEPVQHCRRWPVHEFLRGFWATPVIAPEKIQNPRSRRKRDPDLRGTRLERNLWDESTPSHLMWFG